MWSLGFGIVRLYMNLVEARQSQQEQSDYNHLAHHVHPHCLYVSVLLQKVVS